MSTVKPKIEVNEAQEFITQFAELQAARFSTSGVFQYILEHGKVYGPRIFPKGIRKGIPGGCFRNAYILADNNRKYTYVEGIATSVIPLAHAWCVDKNGQVIDPTWDKKYQDSAYFGVPLSLDVLQVVQLFTRQYGVFSPLNWRGVSLILKNIK